MPIIADDQGHGDASEKPQPLLRTAKAGLQVSFQALALKGWLKAKAVGCKLAPAVCDGRDERRMMDAGAVA